jgi:predicted RNase H-like HicB family nuclease
MPLKGETILEFDKETQEYLAVWEPAIIGMGKTEQEAIKDLTAAAELLININYQNIEVI